MTYDTSTQQWLTVASSTVGIELTFEQLEKFAVYQRELMDWNSRMNLTAIRDPEGIQVKHFADSLACLRAYPDLPVGSRVIDVGTGAGFPGIPIKIVRPDLKLTLVESIQKKAVFLEHLNATLGLDGVTVVALRAEEVAHRPNHREAYQLVLARAVAELRILVEYCLPLASTGGRLMAMKKSGVAAEIADAGRAITILGGRLLPRYTYSLPGTDDERWIIQVGKTRTTSPEYPRRAGLAKKSSI